MKQHYSIDDLRSYGTPTWFGLGFIQLKMDENNRFHFWHPELPTNSVYEHEWHDHRYDFKSSVIVGSITNELASWRSNPSGDHAIWEVCCAGNGATYKGEVDLIPVGSFTTHAGDSYHLSRDALHRVQAERCMTLQTRTTGPVKFKANVVATSFSDSNPFEETLPTDMMWEIISDIVGKPGYHIAEIEKGKLGEISKIREEVDELIDASAQNARIMELVELSDLVGAIEAYMGNHHPSYSFDDLRIMSAITSRAFKNGARS